MDTFIGYKSSGVRRESRAAKTYQSAASQALSSWGGSRRQTAVVSAIPQDLSFGERKTDGHVLKSKLEQPKGNLSASNTPLYLSQGQEEAGSLRSWLEEEVASQLRVISSKMDSFEAKIDGLAEKVTVSKLVPQTSDRVALPEAVTQKVMLGGADPETSSRVDLPGAPTFTSTQANASECGRSRVSSDCSCHSRDSLAEPLEDNFKGFNPLASIESTYIGQSDLDHYEVSSHIAAAPSGTLSPPEARSPSGSRSPSGMRSPSGTRSPSGVRSPTHTRSSPKKQSTKSDCGMSHVCSPKGSTALRGLTSQASAMSIAQLESAKIRFRSITSADDGDVRRTSKFSTTSAALRRLRRTYTGLSVGSAMSAVSGYQNFFRHKYSTKGRFLCYGRIGIYIKNFLEDSESSTAAHIYSIAMPIFITLSVVFTVLQSLEPPVISGATAAVTELVIDVLFLMEAFFRCVVCPDWRDFLKDIYNVIDVIGIVPLVVRIIAWVYIGLRLPRKDSRGWQAWVRGFLLLVVPTIRLLKTLRRFEKFHLVVCAFESCIEALPILLWPLLLITLVFSSLIYSVEPEDNVESLPRAMWLTVVTMTTVGYGDVTPNTTPGSVIVGMLVICSVLYMAMPLGIIGHAFTEIWQERDRILLMKRTRERLLCWGYSPQDVPEVFKMFDRDGDGRLNYSEFHKMIKRMGVGLKEHRILQLFEVFDEDNTGEVDYEEFVNNLFPYRNLLDFIGEKNRQTTRNTVGGSPSFNGNRSIRESYGSGSTSRSDFRPPLTGRALSTVGEGSQKSPTSSNGHSNHASSREKGRISAHSNDSDNWQTAHSEESIHEQMKRCSVELREELDQQLQRAPQDYAGVLPGAPPPDFQRESSEEAPSIE